MTPMSVKRKRCARVGGKFPQQALTNDSLATPPIKVVDVKHDRKKLFDLFTNKAQSVHDSPVQIPGSSTQHNCFDQGVEIWASILKEIKEKFGDVTSIWDDSFPFGQLIEKHFGKQKDLEEFGLEKSFQGMLPQLIRLPFLLLWFSRKFQDYGKEKEAFVEEIAELKNKLSVYEKEKGVYFGWISELKNKLSKYEKEKEAYVGEVDELNNKLFDYGMGKMEHVGEVDELKKKLFDYGKEKEDYVRQIDELKKKCSECEKHLEGLRLDKCEWIARESLLMEENSKIKLKLEMEQDTHKGTVDMLKAQIEELKVQIPLQYEAGVDKVVKQVLSSISKLK